MITTLSSNLASTASEIDKIRNDLFLADVESINSSLALRDRSARTISASYVWLCAILEQYVKTSLRILIDEINSSRTTYGDLKPCLLSIACNPEFTSLQDVRGMKMWNKRVDLLALLNANTPITLSGEEIPLDGKTIQPTHIESVWRIFEFTNSSLPSPRHKLALIDLAEGRNELAHGEILPISFGRGKNLRDCLRILECVEDIVLHINLTFEQYLNIQGYKK
jgi:hypothetical protein